MTLSYLITTLGLIPYFSSRAFVPLLATGLTARFGSQWELTANLAGIQVFSDAPLWLGSDLTLMVLGALAVAEVLLTKSPELREVIALSDAQLKGLATALLCLVLAGQWPLGKGPWESSSAMLQAGFLSELSIFHLWALLIGGSTWWFASLRNRLYAWLRELDADDDLGVQGLLSWLEDGLGFLGVLFVVILPTLALIAAGLALLALFLIQRFLIYREEKQKVPCEHCGLPVAPCGLHCWSCNQPRSHPLQVGILGVIRQRPVRDRVDHRFQLQARKRCPRCGERLETRQLNGACSACSTAPFEHQEELQRYLKRLRGQLPVHLSVLAVLSFIPVLGLIPGILYYRLSLISSLRCYIPLTSRFFARWSVRLLNFVLIILQPVPFFGMFTLPLMCLSNFWIYSRLLVKEGRKKLGRPLPLASAAPAAPGPG
ncbi:MAG: DUF4126 family protein [Acidobacteriota bacterium]